jgi:signal transduction histidine kinase
VLNIVKNAADALDGCADGLLDIHLRYSAEDRMILLSFRDNGPGISPEHSDRLFEPFFTTKEAGKGTGLGLALCKRVIQEHSGKIWVESQLGCGTTVNVALPALAKLSDTRKKTNEDG